RPCLSTTIEQRRVGPRGTNVEIYLAMIFDIGIDTAAIPEWVVPAPPITTAPAEAEARSIKAAVETAVAIVGTAEERIGNYLRLAVIHAIAKLNDHVRGLRAGRRLIAARLELLGNDPRVALKF